ncbi:hypothetical protein B9Z19DRAFT_1063328 [Tuber borchii]|uniref:Uncharacterized protein n=1 Tax=Tuber borchii TaxID=42251 RepID=A0A2T6ZYN1_TUBBO|nr:hypothetical protein B9Z19DRAFT_1063328 [Tuber borchii]
MSLIPSLPAQKEKESQLEDERVAAREWDKERKKKETDIAIVLAVMSIATFQKASRRKDGKMILRDQVKTIEDLQEEPERLGCQTPEQVDELLSVWKGVIADRNTAAHMTQPTSCTYRSEEQ